MDDDQVLWEIRDPSIYWKFYNIPADTVYAVIQGLPKIGYIREIREAAIRNGTGFTRYAATVWWHFTTLHGLEGTQLPKECWPLLEDILGIFDYNHRLNEARAKW
jgi:hypothetical protein